MSSISWIRIFSYLLFGESQTDDQLESAAQQQKPVNPPVTWRSLTRRYVSPVVAVAFGTVFRNWLGARFGVTAPLITYAPLPLLTSTLGGSVAGLIATGLGAIAAIVYFIPSHNFVPRHMGDSVSLLLYILIGATSSTIVGGLRRYAQRTKWQARQVRLTQERLQVQIRRSEEVQLQLAAIVNSTTDAIIGKDVEGKVTSWNKGAETMFGYSAEEMLGKTLDRLLPVNGEIEEKSVLRRVLHQKEMVLRSDAIRIAKDGRTIHAEVSLSPILNAKGDVTGCAQIARDVTEIRTLQRRVQQSQKMDAIGQLTGGIAHDFNNLLAIIIGSLDLQQLVIADNPKALQRWNSAHGAAMRAADLTRRLLAFSSMEQLTAAPTKLDGAIRNVVELSRHVLGPEVILSTNLDGGLPDVLVDPTGLESALLNLAINARDAMPQGGNLSISSSSRHFYDENSDTPDMRVAPGRYACITVTDSGTGMSQEVLERAFEPFFTTKERDAESGLDYFGARYYGSSMGRFMSPDWSAKAEPVPYSSLSNPQTLNLYAYVGNNPLTGLDPDGHAPLDCTGSNASGIGCQTIAQWNTQHEVSASAWASSGFGNVNVSYQNGSYTAQQVQTQSASASQNPDFVSVSYWPKGAGGFGHIGIGVDTDDTQGYSTADPTVPWYKRLFGAPAGGTEDDIAAHTKNGEVAPHGYLHIPITADQAAVMQAAMEARRNDPGHYNLFLNNCAQFVESVLHAGGVSGVPHGEVFGPAILGGMLWLGQH